MADIRSFSTDNESAETDTNSISAWPFHTLVTKPLTASGGDMHRKSGQPGTWGGKPPRGLS